MFEDKSREMDEILLLEIVLLEEDSKAIADALFPDIKLPSDESR